jgi:hypothetical protein
MTSQEIITAAKQLANDADAYFKQDGIEDRATTLHTEAEYKSLFARLNDLIAAFNDRMRICNRQPDQSLSDAACQISEAKYQVTRGKKNVLRRVKSRKIRASVKKRAQNNPLSPTHIYATDLKAEYGITPTKLRALAEQYTRTMMTKLGLKSRTCDFDYDGASWDHHADELKAGHKCICNTPGGREAVHPLGGGKWYGRKFFIRKDVEKILKAARPKAA